MVLQRTEMVQQKEMKVHELAQPGWGDAADYFCQRDKMYSRPELKVPAVGKPQTDNVAVPPAPTIFGELMEYVDICTRISQMLQWTAQPGSSHMRLGSGKPCSNKRIVCLAPDMDPDSLPIQKVKSVESVSFYRCILPPKLITR